MKLYLYRTSTSLSPFGDDVADAQVLLETLLQTQERACRRYGIELVRVDRPSQAAERPCLLAADWTYFSEKALGDFLKTIRRQRMSGAALCLRRCVSVEHTLSLQDIQLEQWETGQARARYDLWMVPEGPLPEQATEVRQALVQRCPSLIVPMKEISIKLRLPAFGEGERFMRLPITSTVCCHISHWAHVLWLSHLAPGIAWMELYRRRKGWAYYKLLAAILRKRSFKLNRLFSGMNCIGHEADIHPTAYLEASILGKGVKVGAGACIRNCVLGDGVVVGDHALVLNSVVADDCFLTENFCLIFSLCYPGSTLGNVKTQMAVIGREVYLHGWCSLIDAKFIGDIKVLHRGQMVGTGKSFMASCIGHRAILGAKVLVHPGREIPNDLLLVSRPEDVIAEIPTDIPPCTPMVRDNGTLITLTSLTNRKTPD
jgi:carbonic anhydrase/acetyltransferase-like protein (isoleucine patch superfamily)